MCRCDAVVDYRATDWSFEPIYCGQVVGVRTYQSAQPDTNIITVAFCSIEGHEANVRRRFTEVGHPLNARQSFVSEPESADPITLAKWEAAR